MSDLPMTYGLVEWLRAVHKAPGTFPPLPDGLDIEKLERNGWVQREGDGWKLSEATSTLGRSWFANEIAGRPREPKPQD